VPGVGNLHGHLGPTGDTGPTGGTGPTGDTVTGDTATVVGESGVAVFGTSLGPGALISDGTHAAWGRATYLDPTTATAHDIVDALIAAGLMAPS
jgi:hypothetical protein